MIKQLDEAARPQGEVQVIELPGGISAPGLQNALRPLGIQAEATPLSRPLVRQEWIENDNLRQEPTLNRFPDAVPNLLSLSEFLSKSTSIAKACPNWDEVGTLKDCYQRIPLNSAECG